MHSALGTATTLRQTTGHAILLTALFLFVNKWDRYNFECPDSLSSRFRISIVAVIFLFLFFIFYILEFITFSNSHPTILFSLKAEGGILRAERNSSDAKG